jgi:hypothetical protein
MATRITAHARLTRPATPPANFTQVPPKPKSELVPRIAHHPRDGVLPHLPSLRTPVSRRTVAHRHRTGNRRNAPAARGCYRRLYRLVYEYWLYASPARRTGSKRDLCHRQRRSNIACSRLMDFGAKLQRSSANRSANVPRVGRLSAAVRLRPGGGQPAPPAAACGPGCSRSGCRRSPAGPAPDRSPARAL